MVGVGGARWGRNKTMTYAHDIKKNNRKHMKGAQTKATFILRREGELMI